MPDDISLLGAANDNNGTGGAGDKGGPGDAAGQAADKAAADKAAADAAAAATASKGSDNKTAKETFEKEWKEIKQVELEKKLTAEGKTADEIKAAVTDAYKAAFDAAFIPKGAPDKYEAFKLPEGLTLDTAVTAKFTGLAKELNLSQEQAQKLIDLQSELVINSGKAQVEAFAKTVAAWKDQTLKELGSDADKKLSIAAKTKVLFGTKELINLLDESGLGNHPEVVKFFIKIGEKVSEDKFAAGKGGAEEKSMADRLYPSKK